MPLQDILGAGVAAYDARRQLEEGRAWQAQQRALQVTEAVRQQQEARLKALQAQGQAFLDAGQVQQAAGLVPVVSELQGGLTGVPLRPPSFVGDGSGNLNNPQTEAAVGAWLGVQPPKPVIAPFGSTAINPRTGEPIFSGAGQRLALEQGKNQTRMDVAELNNDTRRDVAAARIRSAEAMLGRRLSQAERAMVYRREAAMDLQEARQEDAMALETQRQQGREALETQRQHGREALQASRPGQARTVVIQGHRYTVDAQGRPVAHLGAAQAFNEGNFQRTWRAKNGIPDGMPIPDDKLAAYAADLSAARAAHVRSPIRITPQDPGQGGQQPQGWRPRSLMDALRQLEQMPEGRP